MRRSGGYAQWTIVADPYNGSATSIVLEKTFVNIVSEDGKYFWYAAPDGRVRVAREGTGGAVRSASLFNAGNTRLRILCKHGNNQCGTSLDYVKLRFTKQCASDAACKAITDVDVTPLPNGEIEWLDPKQKNHGGNPYYASHAYGITIS